MTKFDDAEIYFLNFTRGLPNEAGGIPIGLYLCWAADAGLVPEGLKHEIAARRERGQSAADLLFDLTDGKLSSGEFTDEGAAFTNDYYGRHYLVDYRRCFRLADDSVDTVCSVADSPASLLRLKPYLNERLIRWRATPRQAPVTPMTTAELLDWLQQRLLPELQADGFAVLKPRRDEIEVHRRHGQIEQILLFMVYTSSGRPEATFHFYLGADRLRRAGIDLLDAPTANFSAPVRHAPDVAGDAHSLADGMFGIAPYFQRFPESREQIGQIRLTHYREWVRPTMDRLDSITRLAEFIHNRGQRLQLSNSGGMAAPILAARVLLLSAYGDHLRGPEGDELLHQLRNQVRRPSSAFADTLLTREQLDQLIERVQQPGVCEQLRAAFAAS